MERPALVSFLRQTLGISVRAAGFLGLIEEGVSHPDDFRKAQEDVGSVIGRLNELIKIMEGKK